MIRGLARGGTLTLLRRDAEPAVLDFMNPARSRRRLIGRTAASCNCSIFNGWRDPPQ